LQVEDENRSSKQVRPEYYFKVVKYTRPWWLSMVYHYILYLKAPKADTPVDHLVFHSRGDAGTDGDVHWFLGGNLGTDGTFTGFLEN
jgi:hypothetical protein